MASRDPKGSRERAQEKFKRAQRNTDEGRAEIDADLDASRSKTTRLRKQRLAKEAAEGVTELDKKPAAKKRS